MSTPYTIQKWLGSKHWHSLLQTVQQCTGREIRNCRKCSFWLSHLKSHVLDSLLWTEKKTKHWSHCTHVKTYFKCWQTLHKRKPMKFNFKNGARLGSKPEGLVVEGRRRLWWGIKAKGWVGLGIKCILPHLFQVIID